MAKGSQNTDVSTYHPDALIGASSVMVILPVIVVALRFYCRRMSQTKVWWDDWIMLISLILVVGGGTVVIIAATIGELGKHQKLSPEGDLVHYQGLFHYERTRYANLLFTTPNLGLIKISILLFYHRLFDVRQFRRVIYGVIGLVSAWTTAFTLTTILQCRPPSLFWELFEIEYGSGCIQVQMFYKSMAYSDLILDVIVLAIPFPIIWTLEMPLRRKMSILEIFLLNTLVLGSGIARLVSFESVISQTSRDPLSFFYDTTWWTSGPLFWTWCETSVAVIGASLPTLAPLWKRQRNGTPSKNSKASKSSSYLRFPNSRLSRPRGQDLLDQDILLTNTKESQSHLVRGAGSIADVHTEDIPLQQRPREGIRVERTFSTNILDMR